MWEKMNQFKKNCLLKVFPLLIFVLVLFVLSGCSSNESYDLMEMNGAEESAISPREPMGFRDQLASEKIGEDGKRSADQEPQEDDIRKIIKDGEIAIEVERLDSSYEEIFKLTRELEGEEFSKNYYSRETNSMVLVIKIPPQNLEKFEEALRILVGKGKVKRSEIKSQDITNQYYDVRARLDSFKVSRDQLQKIMEKAETVEEILSVHRELYAMQAEIEALEGQIKLWDRLVGMATITLAIEEMRNPLARTEAVDWRFSSLKDVGNTMKSGFISVVNVLYSIVMWVFIIVGSLLPVILPGGVIAWFIFRRRKKKNNK
jgi:hypothetical protein